MSEEARRSDLVDVTLVKHAETEKAIFVSDDNEVKHAKWVPKSQIEIERNRANPDVVIVTMPGWLAVEKGFF